MFERIAKHLPQYKLHVQFFADRGRTSSTQALLTALSHVYTDIIMFCQEACKIFSAKKRGVYYKLSVIKDLFWKPFDIRFANLLGRLAKHQELYELELSLADRGELLQHYQKFDKELEQAAEHRQTQSQLAQTEEKDALRRRIREIKAWVNCSDYMTTFEREKANLTADTGQWLLLDPDYLSWLRVPCHDSRHQTFSARVLTVYGSPGYGKTVLSIVVIEDIASHTVSNMQGPDVSVCSVAFFHFDKMTPSCTESHQAMRAILTQIIHQNQSDKDLVDIASVLMDSDGTGQPHASEQEIGSVLALALEHSQNLTLVIDGLDECSNPLQFVQMLYAISQKSSCKIVIFSRPNFQLRQPFLSGNPTIRLRLNSNLSDMQQFLRPQIKEMFVMSLLSPRFAVEEVVFKISTRANSLFLWTKLMLSYLQCLALTPREREEAIDNLNLLEGLDAIFNRIVGTIQNRLQPERQTAFRIFRWLAVAYRPLRLTELRTALAIRLQKPSCSELDYIANFGQALPTICGALVELREDGTVQFIHLSANEYLTDKGTFASIYTPGNLHVDMPTAHLAVAGYALSYLLFDVPNSPLSGSSKVAPDKRHLLDQHPLLEYSLNWCNHAADGLPMSDDLSKSYVDVGCSFLLLASDFLSNSSAVTTWIEARWVFCSTIRETRQLFERTQYQHTLSSNVSPTAQDILKKFDRLASSLRRVSDDIEYLNQEWKHVLKEQPNQIWEPSINMFRESKFLVGTTSAKISWKVSDADLFVSDKSHGIPGKNNLDAREARSLPLPLASQVSADGRLLASVTLIQPP
jgi:Cdc6-like AAA superfamily ATPase